MDPVIRTHTKKNMSVAKEREQEDTVSEETNCNNNFGLGPIMQIQTINTWQVEKKHLTHIKTNMSTHGLQNKIMENATYNHWHLSQPDYETVFLNLPSSRVKIFLNTVYLEHIWHAICPPIYQDP